VSVRFTPDAEADLSEIIVFLREHSPAAAESLLDRLLGLIDRLSEREFEGPEQLLSDGAVVRSWPLPPFRIYYERIDDVLWVLRIYHQARRPITSGGAPDR
jgi:plasmid stabilization system protein ParE